jgi:DNA-binding FadR family transcriptional regulator
MEIYGVSRATFREALRILESHGIVRTRRGIGGGVRVGRPDPAHTVETAADFLRHLGLAPQHLEEVRAAASQTAARLAARRASPEARRKLRDLLAAQLAAQGPANTVAAARVQIQIGDMSGNRALALMMRVVIATIWRDPSAAVRPSLFDELQANHVALVDAISAGDEAMASRRMLKHMQFVRARLEAPSGAPSSI